MKERKGKAYDCIVIGAGMSGISFAHNLRKAGQEVLLIDRDNRPGGQVHTHRPAAFPDFWNEMGSHTCYNSYIHMLSMMKESGVMDSVLETEKYGYVMYADGQTKSISSQIKKIPFALNCLKMFTANKEGKTVREYFEPIVGRGNYKPLFSNTFRAVICQNADEYPAEMFLKRRKERMESIPRKYMFRGGLSSVLEGIISADGVEAKYDTEVSGIIHSGGLFTVTTSRGEEFKATNIAVAVDPESASRLLQNVEAEVSELLGSITLSRSESRSVIVDKSSLKLKPVSFILPMSDDFYSVVSRDPVSHPHLRGFTFHFEQDKLSEDQQRKIIYKILEISQDDILEEKHITHVLPATRMKHLDIDGKIKSASSNTHIYYLGNYYYGLSLEDCVHRSMTEFERYKTNMEAQ